MTLVQGINSIMEQFEELNFLNHMDLFMECSYFKALAPYAPYAVLATPNPTPNSNLNHKELVPNLNPKARLALNLSPKARIAPNLNPKMG